MTNLTRNGVCKSLAHSPYTFTEFNTPEPVTFYFSSKLYLENFIKRRADNYYMLYNYIYKRFKVKVNVQYLSDCNLYQKIEKRGFYIKVNNKGYSSCPTSLTLSGDLKMKENSEELSKTSMPNLQD